jgi:hypothetical protein
MGMSYMVLAGAIMLASWLVAIDLKVSLNFIQNCNYKME